MAKPTFIISTIEGVNQVSASGDLTVQHAYELKSNLHQVIERTGAIHLAFDKADSFDTSAIQLTYAFKKEMEKYGRKVSLLLPVNESLIDLLTKTGITKIL